MEGLKKVSYLDLHGYSVAQAVGLVADHFQLMTDVVLITGKGLDSPGGIHRIKNQLVKTFRKEGSLFQEVRNAGRLRVTLSPTDIEKMAPVLSQLSTHQLCPNKQR